MQTLKYRLVRRVLGAAMAAAGLGLVAVSLAWDVLRGQQVPQLGRRELVGVLTGLAIGVAGGWLLVTDRPAAQLARWGARWRIAISLALLTTALAVLLPRNWLFPAAGWIAWGYFLAACLLLPARLGTVTFLSGAAAGALLTAINALKVSWTGLPLTMLDVKIALGNPSGLWNALHLPGWMTYAAILVTAVAGLLTAHAAMVSGRGILQSGPPRRTWSRAAVRTGGIAVIGLLSLGHFNRLFAELGSYRNTWDIAGVTAMAADVGVMPFLAYSNWIEDSDRGIYFSDEPGAEPPTSTEIRAAVQRQIDFGATPGVSGWILPNIVVVLAESTFDPDTAFRLSSRVESPLFTAGAQTAAVGPLLVNVVGGGTWVTEFETITGLDSRLFGYAGYYTHASLSPYVSYSLAKYMRAKGYRTMALLPHDGDFYNYRRAYEAYGFNEVSDNRDRGRSSEWRQTDLQIVEDFRKAMGPDPEEPFFSYVLLIENHGPHKCDVRGVEDIPVRFADTTDFEANCPLHEYLRRLRSTEAALASLIDYLRGLEQQSGRPFVVLAFGDHQPYSFTGTHSVNYDFNPFRRAVGKNMTFFHLWTSTADRIACCETDIPATLLATLISTFAATGPDDVYLGLNLWLYENCGSDWVHGRPQAELSRRRVSLLRSEGPIETAAQTRPDGCTRERARALTAIRSSGILNFQPGD